MAGVDLDLVARLERSMLTSWPALSTAFDGDWVIRLADGYSNRANSVTCLGKGSSDLDARIARVENIYREAGLPPVFRLSPLAPPELHDALDQRGWNHFGHSIVMTSDLNANCVADRDAADRIEIKTTPDPAWLEGRRCIDAMGRANIDALKRLLDVLIPLAGYGCALSSADRVDALALAVVDAELVGLFEVMTAPDQRRQGLARALMAELLRWGKKQSATTGWLAVEAGNLPALRLYQGLGFREVYRYHYRSDG